MRTIHPSKSAAALIAGLALAGSLAACSSPAATDNGGDTGGDTGSDSGDTGGDSGDTGSDTGAYADGTYEASGDYQAPSGTESVDVTVTLEGGVITDVAVVGGATDPQAQIHQGEFIDGIAGVVVGKPIDEIQVSKVSGSSLTSGGFNKAIEEIKAEAAS
jgi:uncharacterized protein with FMN-binding domain